MTTSLDTIECKHCDGTGEIDPIGHLDLDSIEAIRAELVYIATKAEHGITSGNRIDRMQTLGRIGFLASRLVWLEANDFLRQPSTDNPIPR
jgi:hypothetical protein